MTIKEDILKKYFESLSDDFIPNCMEEDVDYDNNKLKKDGIQETKEILAMRAKAVAEYIDGFFEAVNIDPNTEMGVDNSLATDLLLKCLTGNKNEG